MNGALNQPINGNDKWCLTPFIAFDIPNKDAADALYDDYKKEQEEKSQKGKPGKERTTKPRIDKPGGRGGGRGGD